MFARCRYRLKTASQCIGGFSPRTVANLGEARRIVDLYRMRWTIEEFFRTLKTASFNIEDADIGDPAGHDEIGRRGCCHGRHRHAVGQSSRWTLSSSWPTLSIREDQPLLEALSLRLEGATERQKNPHPKGSLSFATWVIARLGGWTGYYGKPGPKVISRDSTTSNASNTARNSGFNMPTRGLRCVNPIALSGGGTRPTRASSFPWRRASVRPALSTRRCASALCKSGYWCGGVSRRR